MTWPVLMIFLAACSVPKPPNTAPIRGVRPGVERQVIDAVNAERSRASLWHLVEADVIRHEARVHSADMRDGQTPLGHSGFQARIDAIGEDLVVITAGENVTTNKGFADPAAQAIDDWLASSEHHANLVGDFDLTGVGVVEGPTGVFWFTQVFVMTW